MYIVALCERNRSQLKAKQAVEWMTPCLALAFAGVVPMETIVARTVQMMSKGCTINSRKRRPNTYQLLAEPQLNSSQVDAYWGR
ncbi:MAG: hypothetical protein NVS4B7_21810 [Ktedonobacteraceae bacterium]